MKRLNLFLIFLTLVFSLVSVSCRHLEGDPIADVTPVLPIANSIQKVVPVRFDSTLVAPFFEQYPKLLDLQPAIKALYQNRHYEHLWYDSKGLNEFAYVLYDKINNLEEEGVPSAMPYKDKIAALFQSTETLGKPKVNMELFLTSMYFYYEDRVFKGLPSEKSVELGWYLPRKKQTYAIRLDSLLQKPTLFGTKEKEVLNQYYLLRTALREYRIIEQKGGWDAIALPSKFKSLRFGDTLGMVLSLRKRLVVSGDLAEDNQSNLYDTALLTGLLRYKKRHGFSSDSLLLPKHIKDMNISVAERITTLMVNMERCRWVSPELMHAKTFVMVNIPSYSLTFFRDGQLEMVSKVVVGKLLNKTVVFSGEMRFVVFSPYWNVPTSILRKEILPAIAKNRNYLSQHRMEWHNKGVRQRPGPQNSLGLVKFLFPNSNNIYLHDTPSKNLFKEDRRAFSHGCIRVERARDLAIAILRDDPEWSIEQIDAAMNRGVERTYRLRDKIPVYIGYFTAWVDKEGAVHFYDDVYQRDKRLAELLLAN